MAIQRTLCFMLRKYPLRETSWIVTVLTHSFGKVKGIVKGARTPKSNWPPVFELLTEAEIVFYEKTRSNLHLISHATLINRHQNLRSKLGSFAYGSYFAELVDELCEEGVSQGEVYQLLEETVSILDRETLFLEGLARAFEIKLFDLLGLMPHVSGCIGCAKTRLHKIYFSPKHGGIFCEECRENYPGGFLVSEKCLDAIGAMQNASLDEASKIQLDGQAGVDLAQMHKRFIEYRIERRLNSLKVLEDLYSSRNYARS